MKEFLRPWIHFQSLSTTYWELLHISIYLYSVAEPLFSGNMVSQKFTTFKKRTGWKCRPFALISNHRKFYKNTFSSSHHHISLCAGHIDIVKRRCYLAWVNFECYKRLLGYYCCSLRSGNVLDISFKVLVCFSLLIYWYFKKFVLKLW